MIQSTIEAIPNHAGNRTYIVALDYAGFRCQQEVNPQLTNFAQLRMDYAPAEKLYDFVSLIDYLKSFEPVSMSLETAANRIVDDLFAHLKPVWARVIITQQREHGVKIEIVAEAGCIRNLHHGIARVAASSGRRLPPASIASSRWPSPARYTPT